MVLTFPREPIVEGYLGGWRDITSDVRQGTIAITRGRKDEDPKVPPSRCTFVLDDGPDHGNGNYHPRNPMGQWFGQLGRNTPVRVALRAGRDDFARTVGSGWGTSPTDGPYTDFVSAGTTAGSVSGGQGRHDITSTAAFRASYLDDVHVKNVELRVNVTIGSVSDVTGGDLEPANLLLRGQTTSTYYMLRVVITSAEAVTLRLMVGSSETLAGPITVPGLTYGGQTLTVAFQADANTFRGKIWKVTDPEPLSWHLTYSHGDVHGAGWVGVRSGVGSGNTNTKPVSFRYTNLEIRLPRFAGETAKMLPLSEVDHSNQRTQVECAGLLRRLSQGTKPLQSAARRFLGGNPAITLADYWPLEEKPNETSLGTNLLGGLPALFIRDTSTPSNPTGAIKWGSADGLASIERAPEISNGANLFFRIRTTNLTSGWTILWVQRISSDAGAFIYIDTNVTNADVQLKFNTNGTYEVYREPVHTLMFSGTFPEFGRSDEWHLIAISCNDFGGGQVDYELSIDAAGPTGQLVSLSFPQPMSIEMFTLLDTNEFCAFGQVGVSTQHLLSGSPQLWTQIGADLFGHPGEVAGVRFNRLCDEEGIPHAMVGYPTLTVRMGPQRPLTILALLQECADAEQGTLYEPRGDIGLALRTNRATTAQTPAVVLDYANSEVAPDFGPTDDDATTVNDVTARRPDGGRYQTERATGPMNTADPGTNPDAVGRYDTSIEANVEQDGLLIDVAEWRVHIGTVNEPRYPTITVDLSAPAVASQSTLVAELLDVDIDDPITVTGAQAARIFDDVRQIVRGYTEILDTAYRHRLVFNTTPASPYDVMILDDATYGRLDTAEHTINEPVDTTETVVSVVRTGGVSASWTTTEEPFDIMVGGERMTVTSVFNTGAVQDLTVTRSVNGVVKSHDVGTPFSLADPVYLGVVA